MLVIHKRRTHTALELLCIEWHSIGQNLLSCFTILLNKILGWEICYVFFHSLHSLDSHRKPANLSLNMEVLQWTHSTLKFLNSWGNIKILTWTILWKILIKSCKVITILWTLEQGTHSVLHNLHMNGRSQMF